MNEIERADFHTDFERALAFATRLHAPQTRKQTDIPYISHLIGVAGLVLENGGDRDQAIAGLLLVSCADKLHNARAIVADLRVMGDALFDRFSGKRDGTLWYYRSLAEVFGRRGPAQLAAELGRTVETMKALAD